MKFHFNTTGSNIVLNIALLLFGATLVISQLFPDIQLETLYVAVGVILVYSAAFRCDRININIILFYKKKNFF